MASYAFVTKGLSKSYQGAKPVFRDISISFFAGSKIGVIGENGAGKSSLLKIMAGQDKEFVGEAWAAKGLKVGYLPQEPVLDEGLTVYENILQNVHEVKRLIDKYDEISMSFTEDLDEDSVERLLNEQLAVQEQIEASDGWNIEKKINVAMKALGCPPGESLIKHLSGGEKRRVALCGLLLSNHDILLLDEPTNHLDTGAVLWLENFLIKYSGMVVLITHDRYFLDNVVEWILELDHGQAYPFQGNYSAWLEEKQKRLGLEKKKESDRQKLLEKELAWIRENPKARQSKNKARIIAYENLLNQAAEFRYDPARITIPAGPRLGDLVIRSDGVSKTFGEKCLLKDLSFNLPKGAILGVVGFNGAGKTTLLKLITGEERPDDGKIIVGETVQLGFVTQSRETLNNNKTVWQEISGGLEFFEFGKLQVSTRAYCAQFNFRGNDQQKLVGNLSGGERNRLHLAKVLQSGANLMLLDEPTNDLDVDTLRSLEEGIENFAGSAIIVSHDRWFLDRVVTHILALEGDGSWTWHIGSYSDYAEFRGLK